MSQLESGAAVVGVPLTETVAEDSIADYLKSHPIFSSAMALWCSR
jgi:hypothetical protein